MALQPPLSDLAIKTADAGFYRGVSVNGTVIGKIINSMLLVWCIVWPVQAGATLGNWNAIILNNFAAWFIWVVVFFSLLVLAWHYGLRRGNRNSVPEFSNSSWFSMMFGAGIGVGMLTWAVAEPVAHFQNNPSVIQGLTTAGGADNIRTAYVWSGSHGPVAPRLIWN